MMSRSIPSVWLVVLLSGLTSQVEAGITESWEQPMLSPGTSTPTLPGGWRKFSGPDTDSQVYRANSLAQFNAVGPLAAPADGDQLLFLQGTNTGVYLMTGEQIQANFNYQLSAAIGNNRQEPNTQFWSLQLWADTNGSNGFDGGDTFIGQQFGTNLGAINPATGEWATSSFSFVAADRNVLVGQQLIIFLNNYGNGTSYYDNISLISPVPEPATASAFFSYLISTVVVVLRRRQSMS